MSSASGRLFDIGQVHFGWDGQPLRLPNAVVDARPVFPPLLRRDGFDGEHVADLIVVSEHLIAKCVRARSRGRARSAADRNVFLSIAHLLGADVPATQFVEILQERTSSLIFMPASRAASASSFALTTLDSAVAAGSLARGWVAHEVPGGIRRRLREEGRRPSISTFFKKLLRVFAELRAPGAGVVEELAAVPMNGGWLWRRGRRSPGAFLPPPKYENNESPTTKTNIKMTPAIARSVFWYLRKARKGLAMSGGN